LGSLPTNCNPGAVRFQGSGIRRAIPKIIPSEGFFTFGRFFLPGFIMIKLAAAKEAEVATAAWYCFVITNLPKVKETFGRDRNLQKG
jgi:hypothetical protein